MTNCVCFVEFFAHGMSRAVIQLRWRSVWLWHFKYSNTLCILNVVQKNLAAAFSDLCSRLFFEHFRGPSGEQSGHRNFLRRRRRRGTMLTLNPISPTHFTTRMGRGEPGRRVYNGMHAKERQRSVAWPWFLMKKTQNPLFFPRMTFKPRSDGARDEDRHFYGVFLGAWESVVASLSFLCMGRRSCILHTTQKRLREVGKKFVTQHSSSRMRGETLFQNRYDFFL